MMFLLRSRRWRELGFGIAAGLLGLAGVATNAGAANPADEFAVEAWTTEHGLPQSSITAVIQTRGGYILASTYNGLAQFDGARFKVFDTSNTEGMPNSRITALFEDARGDVYVGHDTGEMTRFRDGHFEPVPIRSQWSGGTIYGIAASSNGELWALNIRGEAVRVADGRLIKPTPELAADFSLIPQLFLDAQGRLLVVRNGYVAELTPDGYRKVDFPSNEVRPYRPRLAVTRDGGLWVPGEGRIRKWNGDNWTDDLGIVPWSDAATMTMLETRDGRLLVGTLERGLFIHDPRHGWMNLNRTNGLPHDWVRCLSEDREHNIWVGTSGGLMVLRPRKVVMHSPPDAWEGRPVLAIAPDAHGSVWAATEGAGLYRLTGDTWTHYGGRDGLANLFIWSVLVDRQQRVWAGAWGGGLFCLEKDKFVRRFDLAERGEAVTALKEFPPGTLWIGTDVGLIRVTDDQLERFAPLGGAAAGDVRALEIGSHGELWIGTQGNGLGRFQDGKLQTFRRSEGLPRNFILSLLAEPDGTLWLGMLDRGICRFRNGRFDSITTEHGIPNNVIGHIADDGLGNLWFSSQRGLFRASKSDLHACADGKLATLPTLVFGKAEGLATLACSSGFTPAGFRAADGKLWFPTTRGIAVVNPQAVRQNEVPPSVWIEELLVDGQHAEMRPPPLPGRGPGANLRANRLVELPPGRRSLDVLFTGISFTSPERVQFKYRLEGLDQEWTDAGTRRRVTYPFLPPGEYVFRVKACNGDGLWNESGDALGIIMLPHLWQTWWFRVLLTIVSFAMVGGGVYLGVRRRHRHKLERIARERELERERARIAQDIHDDLGASLTRIGMLSESATEDLNDPPRAVASLGQIYSTARDLTRAMDEIVWAVNPRHDTLDSLANYVTRFAHDFLSTAHIRCRLDAPMQFPDLTVRSEVRHNLFLAFKETLNNAVKHSKASEVRVTLELAAGGLNLVVADNGSGFDPAKALPASTGNRVISGYGIGGIRNRLEQVDGRVEIRSTPGSGTRVELYVPLPELARIRPPAS